MFGFDPVGGLSFPGFLLDFIVTCPVLFEFDVVFVLMMFVFFFSLSWSGLSSSWIWYIAVGIGHPFFILVCVINILSFGIGAVCSSWLTGVVSTATSFPAGWLIFLFLGGVVVFFPRILLVLSVRVSRAVCITSFLCMFDFAAVFFLFLVSFWFTTLVDKFGTAIASFVAPFLLASTFRWLV